MSAMSAQAAPSLQYGGPEGWYYTPDPGPATDDVAWQSTMEGSRAALAVPLIIGESVYVLETNHSVALNGSQPRLHRFSVATGERTVFATFSQSVQTMASDGQRMFVAGVDSLMILSLEDGSILQELEYPDDAVPNRHQTICFLVRIEPPRLYVLCMIVGNYLEASRAAENLFEPPFRDLVRFVDGGTSARTFVAAYDLDSGEREWEYFIDASAHGGQSPPATGMPGQVFGASGLFPIVVPTGLTVIENYTVVSGGYWEGFEDWTTRSHMEGHCFHTVLNSPNGTVRARFTSIDQQYMERAGTTDDPLTCVFASELQGDKDTIFGKFQNAFTIDPEHMSYLRTEVLEASPYETGFGIAYDGTHAYMGSWKRVYKFNSDLGIQRSFGLEAGDALIDFAPTLTPNTLFILTHHDQEGQWHTRGALYALDAASLEKRWRFELPHAADSLYGFNYLHAVGEGLVILAGMDGRVLALGNTAGSPTPVAALSNLYPTLNEVLELDLSQSKAGTGGPPKAFRAEWGDGSITDWQESPILSHSYAKPPPNGEAYTVRAQVRNVANQTASSFLQVYAGGTPAAPPLVEERDAPTSAKGAAPMERWPMLGSILAILAVLAIVPLVVLITRTRQRVAAVYQIIGGHPAERFEVVRELGRGAYGVAQLARDTQLDRLVVLKQAYGSIRMSQSQRNRFLREAKMAARIQHPNVVSVFEVLPDQDPPVMVLEYAPGGSLEDLLQTGRVIDQGRARSLAMDILQGLAAVHGAGVLHRDLKPSNVLLDSDGRAKVADFGIAVPALQPGANETMAFGGPTLGTMAYMSPERIRGEPATEKSDLYAAAAIAYRMFTGRHHAHGRDGSVEAVRNRILKARPTVDEKSVPPALQPVLKKALANDPRKRFFDVKTFLAEFGAASMAVGDPR